MIILFLFSILAGLVTVLSPCILPILPVLLAAGTGTGRYRPLGIVIGLVLSFTFFTLALTTIVQLTGLSPNFLRYVAITLITFFGLTMLFPQLEARFALMTSSVARLGNKVQETAGLAGVGFSSGFIVGIALGLLWTPCAGPILAAITTLVATKSITWGSVFVTLAYSIGAAIPMFLIAYGSNKIINVTSAFIGYTEIIRKFFGVLMILGALSIALHFDTVLQQLTLKYFPAVSFETHDIVRNALKKLIPDSTDETNDFAPEIVGIHTWLNSPALSLEQLRGHVVLVDFWTYSCINCIRTLPHLTQWYNDYKDKGFVIIGVHTPEFEFEKDVHNVSDAIKRFNIKYPVALDSDYKTWQNYNNHYWPAHFLIDQQGVIQETHFGEGGYQETENAIRKLLGLPELPEKNERTQRIAITPETYLGYARARAYTSEISLKKETVAEYTYTHTLADNQVGLNGLWFIGSEYIATRDNNCSLDLNFIAGRVHLVMQSQTPQLVTVLLDDKPVPANYHTADMNEQGQVQVHEPRKYDILNLQDNHSRHKLTLQFPENVSAYVFTFGG